MKDLADAIAQIRQQGYCKLPQLFSQSTTQKLLDLCIEWREKTEDLLPREIPYLNRNQPSVYNAQNKDFLFLEALFASAEVEFILKHYYAVTIGSTRPGHGERGIEVKSCSPMAGTTRPVSRTCVQKRAIPGKTGSRRIGRGCTLPVAKSC